MSIENEVVKKNWADFSNEELARLEIELNELRKLQERSEIEEKRYVELMEMFNVSNIFPNSIYTWESVDIYNKENDKLKNTVVYEASFENLKAIRFKALQDEKHTNLPIQKVIDIEKPQIEAEIIKLEATVSELQAYKEKYPGKQVDESIDKTSYLLSAYKKYLEWLNEKLANVNTKTGTQEQKEPNKLEMFFDSVSKYKNVMGLLVDKGYCQPNTYIWKDDKKGNKSLLVAIIRQLHLQGFYKCNKKPTHNQIKEIAKNTFGLKIEIDTIKKNDLSKHDVSFIPIASTLK